MPVLDPTAFASSSSSDFLGQDVESSASDAALLGESSHGTPAALSMTEKRSPNSAEDNMFSSDAVVPSGSAAPNVVSNIPSSAVTQLTSSMTSAGPSATGGGSCASTSSRTMGTSPDASDADLVSADVSTLAHSAGSTDPGNTSGQAPSVVMETLTGAASSLRVSVLVLFAVISSLVFALVTRE